MGRKRRSKARGNPEQRLLFNALLRERGLPEPVHEHRFTPPRLFRFDYAWTRQRVALEVDGGVWTQGRHTRGAGVLKDQEKLNLAASSGWLVLRTVPKQLLTDALVEVVERTLRYRGWKS